MCRVIEIGLVLLSMFGGFSNRADAADERRDRESLARVKYLIEMLASKNAAPVVKGKLDKGEDEEITFPKTYDNAAQVPVYLAVQQLLSEGEMAIDPLLDHAKDKRYSFSVNFSNRDFNVGVSEACKMIAEAIVFGFEAELHVLSRSQFSDAHESFMGDLSFERWWRKNKKKGLVDAQLKAVDAMTAYMKSVNGKTASTVHPEAERLPLKEFNQLREDNLRILKAIRESIADRKEPYRAKSLDDQNNYLFGLPWTTRRHNL